MAKSFMLVLVKKAAKMATLVVSLLIRLSLVSLVLKVVVFPAVAQLRKRPKKIIPSGIIFLSFAMRAVIDSIWGLIAGEAAFFAARFLVKPVAVGVELGFDQLVV